MSTIKKVLIVVTNSAEFEKVGYRTGLWLSELTHFWDVLEKAGLTMDIASPAGGYVPIDPESLLMPELIQMTGLKDAVNKRYEDRAFMDQLKNTQCVAEVDASQYEAIYLTGGHGVMFDFANNEALAELIAEFYENNKIVAAVCHGPCGLLNVKLSSGDYLIKDKKLTGFSWKEEQLAKRDHAVPFSLQDELAQRGAHYEKALIPFTEKVVEDGLLITGQNPKSAHAVGQAVLSRLNS
jgi:putative intracellular protease/amidase